MHWLYLLIGFAILIVSFLTTNSALMVVCWLVALGLYVAMLRRSAASVATAAEHGTAS